MEAVEEEFAIELDPEDLKQASRVLAEVLLSAPRGGEAPFVHVAVEGGCEVVGDELAIGAVDLDLMASAAAGVLDPLGQLKEWFTDILNSIASWVVSGIEAFISTYITPALDVIGGGVSEIISQLADIPGLVVSAITQEFPALVSDIANSVASTVETVVLDPIRSFVDWVSAQFASLTPIADAIISALSGIPSLIDSLSADVMSTFTDLTTQISSALPGLANMITATFADLSSTITSGLASMASMVDGIISAIGSIPGMVAGAISNITAAISSALAGIPGFISTSIIPALTGILDFISASVMPALGGIPGLISEGIMPAIAGISDFISSSVMPALAGIPSFISDNVMPALEAVPDLILTNVVQPLIQIPDLVNIYVVAPILKIPEILDVTVRDVLGVTVIGGFLKISSAIFGFTNSIMNFPNWFPKWFAEGISKPIVDGIKGLMVSKPVVGHPPMFYREAYTPEKVLPVADMFLAPVRDFFEQTVKTMEDTIIKPLVGSVEDLVELLWGGVKTIWGTVVGFLKDIVDILWEGLKDVVGGIGIALRDIFTGFWKMFSELPPQIVGPFQEFVKSIYDPIPKTTASLIRDQLSPTFKAILEGLGMETPEFLKIDVVSQQFASAVLGTITIIFLPFWGQIPTRLASWTGKALARWLGNIQRKIRINLRPLGIGVDTEFDLAKALGASLYTFSDELMKYVETVGRGLAYGFSIWLSQPVAKVANYAFRNYIPIELPGLNTITEFVRRTLPHETSQEVVKLARYYMGLYGYSDVAIDWILKSADELYITVKDRFGAERKVPLSLVYALPSASDVATMMVRDIFPSMEEFQKLYSARGMHPDVGALYYFLRFRYPPPERLWEFTARGISGLLWMTLPDAEKKWIEDEIKPLGAYMPISPTDLNFQAGKLFGALKTYMKWHDYFRGAWVEGFTSDNLIMADTLADIPTKIDQRWITKWGLYELLSEKGVGLMSPVEEFAAKVIEDAPASEVKMDLTLFSRTLQGTGLHPDWVPLTAVGEAINALADERTLLRTGFINLFKEGFWDVQSLETLLAGVITASFRVAHFDIRKMRWTIGWINHPVMFLPAERKLLELRALMDRALDVLRDATRDVSRGYSEWIVQDYDEFKGKLTGVIDSINKFFSADYKKITGADLPEELKLKFVEAYYKPYIESLNIWRDIYTVRRVRYWTQRWLGWVMYRVGTGVVKKEDIDALVTYIAEKAKLTPYEREFIGDVMGLLAGIAQREYIPTPSQLATMSEYVVISQDLIGKVLDARKVPGEWREIWSQYIDVRPIADDVRGLLTAYRRALLYVTIPKELNEKVKGYASLIGFTQREWEILGLRVQLEEMIQEARGYIPTPPQLATLAEYMVISPSLIEEVFKVRRVPDEWRAVWRCYIDVRPIAGDVRGLLTTYRRALLYVDIPDEVKDRVMKYAALINFGDRELDILNLRVQLEELIQQSREYIPTPSMLASLAEYMTLPDQLVEGVLQRRKVPDEWKEIWKKLIEVRPLADDVRGLLTTYRRALLYAKIPEDVEKKVKEYADLINFTQREWDILNLRVQLEELIMNSREYIPTPYSLATICEYIPKARQFFDEVVKARRIPKEWIPIWAEYVDLRPIVNEVRRMVGRVEDLYTYFVITEDAYRKVLDQVKKFGYTDKEIELMLTSSKYERYLRAWRELVGDVDRMTMLAEYSPDARTYALGQLYKMIDALPIDDQTKAVLKKMWEQFIRLRPIMDEVRRYITELLTDFAQGVITEKEFVSELEALKEWGLDDYEIMFYKAIGGMRRARYMRRRAGG